MIDCLSIRTAHTIASIAPAATRGMKICVMLLTLTTAYGTGEQIEDIDIGHVRIVGGIVPVINASAAMNEVGVV